MPYAAARLNNDYTMNKGWLETIVFGRHDWAERLDHFGMLNFVWARNSPQINGLTVLGLIFGVGCAFGKCVLPEGLAREPSKMLEIQKCFDPIDHAMVFTITPYKFNATNTSDAFEHVTDLFWRSPGPENMVRAPGPEIVFRCCLI